MTGSHRGKCCGFLGPMRAPPSAWVLPFITEGDRESSLTFRCVFQATDHCSLAGRTGQAHLSPHRCPLPGTGAGTSGFFSQCCLPCIFPGRDGHSEQLSLLWPLPQGKVLVQGDPACRAAWPAAWALQVSLWHCRTGKEKAHPCLLTRLPQSCS